MFHHLEAGLISSRRATHYFRGLNDQKGVLGVCCAIIMIRRPKEQCRWSSWASILDGLGFRLCSEVLTAVAERVRIPKLTDPDSPAALIMIQGIFLSSGVLGTPVQKPTSTTCRNSNPAIQEYS